jgi:hypothetical protein
MKSQTILGICMIILGSVLTSFIIPAILLKGGFIVGVIYGVPILLIGIFLIIFRNSEDKIEKIREDKNDSNKHRRSSSKKG